MLGVCWLDGPPCGAMPHVSHPCGGLGEEVGSKADVERRSSAEVGVRGGKMQTRVVSVTPNLMDVPNQVTQSPATCLVRLVDPATWSLTVVTCRYLCPRRLVRRLSPGRERLRR